MQKQCRHKYKTIDKVCIQNHNESFIRGYVFVLECEHCGCISKKIVDAS